MAAGWASLGDVPGWPVLTTNDDAKRGCGKHPHRSEGKANAQIRAMRRRSDDQQRRGEPGDTRADQLQAYICTTCTLADVNGNGRVVWHAGHIKGGDSCGS